MFVENWFPSAVVWYSDIDDIKNDLLAEYTLHLAKSDSGRVVSNYGGWQSSERLPETENFPELKKLIESINENLSALSSEYHYKKIPKVSDYWINLNSKGNFNFPHTHGVACISGVYYVKVTGGGKFRIYRSQEEQWLWNTFTTQEHPDTANYCEYPAKESRVLMFPSWVSHMVTPLNDDSLRISIAFNAY